MNTHIVPHTQAVYSASQSASELERQLGGSVEKLRAEETSVCRDIEQRRCELKELEERVREMREEEGRLRQQQEVVLWEHPLIRTPRNEDTSINRTVPNTLFVYMQMYM